MNAFKKSFHFRLLLRSRPLTKYDSSSDDFLYVNFLDFLNVVPRTEKRVAILHNIERIVPSNAEANLCVRICKAVTATVRRKLVSPSVPPSNSSDQAVFA